MLSSTRQEPRRASTFIPMTLKSPKFSAIAASVPLALTFSEDGGEVVFAREEERMAWEDAIARCERVIASSDRSPDGPSFLDLFDESNAATE